MSDLLTNQPNITILGAGAWGTAMAHLCYQYHLNVTLWCHETRVINSVPDCPNLTITCDLLTALTNNCDYVLIAIPVAHLRPLLQQIKLLLTPAQIQKITWVSLAKGLEQETLYVPTHMITELLAHPLKLAALAGPSFANELLKQHPTGVMIASADLALAEQICSLFASAPTSNSETSQDAPIDPHAPALANPHLHTDCHSAPGYFHPTPTTDLLGVQLCSALKNVYALGAGILTGAGYGANTVALLLTQSLQELTQLVTQAGGQRATVYSLAGLGDLILTAYSLTSRNTQVGYKLGQGQPLATILSDPQQATVEGLNTLLAIPALAQKYRLKLPICDKIYQVVYQQSCPEIFSDF